MVRKINRSHVSKTGPLTRRRGAPITKPETIPGEVQDSDLADGSGATRSDYANAPATSTYSATERKKAEKAAKVQKYNPLPDPLSRSTDGRSAQEKSYDASGELDLNKDRDKNK